MSGAGVSMDVLARRCFESSGRREMRALDEKIEIKRRKKEGEDNRSLVGCGAVLLLVGTCYSGVSLGGAGMATFLGLIGGIWVLRKVVKFDPYRRRRSEIRRSVADGIAAYERGEFWAVMRVHEFAVDDFRDRIQRHRARTLGGESEWGLARASLAEAADEAQRSAAYWRERLRVEPENKLALSQGEVAAKLRVKLGEALRKLDQRADALRKFYNDCDARIAVMAGRNRDLEESRRLEKLSGRADVAIAQAEGVIQSIATAFVADAQNMAEALGVVSTFGVKSLAGDAPIDDIEYYADRIIEDSDRERSAIEDLDRRLLYAAR